MSYFNLSFTWRLVLATLSGLLAVPATSLAEVLTELMPLPERFWLYILVGSIFGALIAMPFITAERGKLWRAAGLILSSILIYALAVELVIDGFSLFSRPDFLSEYVLSGCLGALLVALAIVIIAPIKASLRLWLYAAGAGIVGGLVFFGLFEAEEWASYFVYLPWQLLVFGAVYVGSQVRNDQ